VSNWESTSTGLAYLARTDRQAERRKIIHNKATKIAKVQAEKSFFVAFAASL
jgi:hypothetical protein